MQKNATMQTGFWKRDDIFYHLTPRVESLRLFSTMNGVGPGQNQKTCPQNIKFLQKSPMLITAKLRLKYVKIYAFLWVFFRIFLGFLRVRIFIRVITAVKPGFTAMPLKPIKIQLFFFRIDISPWFLAPNTIHQKHQCSWHLNHDHSVAERFDTQQELANNGYPSSTGSHFPCQHPPTCL